MVTERIVDTSVGCSQKGGRSAVCSAAGCKNAVFRLKRRECNIKIVILQLNWSMTEKQSIIER